MESRQDRGLRHEREPLLDRQAGKRPREADDGHFGRGVGNETPIVGETVI